MEGAGHLVPQYSDAKLIRSRNKRKGRQGSHSARYDINFIIHVMHHFL